MTGRAWRVSPVSHTGRAARGRGKSRPVQLVKGPCQRAIEVVFRIGVPPRKARASAAEQILDGDGRCALSQQLLRDPFIGDTSVGLRESLRNSQPVQPVLIDSVGWRGLGDGDDRISGRRMARRSGSRNGTRSHLALRRHQQRGAVDGQASLGVQESHPRWVPVVLAPREFLVGEAGQPSQMTPVGTGQVSLVSVSQVPRDGGGHGGSQRKSTDANPGLKMAGAGLEHHTGLMAIGSHPFEGRRITVIEIQQDVAGIQVLGIGLDVDVTAFAIPNAQESESRFAAQLGSRPEAFSRECSSGSVVNQADQVKLVRHCRQLPADRLPREEEPAIRTLRHEHHYRRADSPYNAFMVRPCGRKGKELAANSGCPNSGLSQKGAHAATRGPFGVPLANS